MPTTEIEESRQTLIEHALSKYWGFDSLRPMQAEVVEASLNHRDAVVVMPTGGGKSLCFQLPAVVSESLTVVISPLIALMKDQVDALRVVGVNAAALNSSITESEEVQIYRDIAENKLRLLYISPERFLLPSTLEMLIRAGVARFAIDEAHCISAWGHDFRPEFRQLSRIKEVFPRAPVQAFTATATPQVQRDIAIQLKLERPRKFVGVFDRPNLTYRIVAKDNAVRRTIEAVKRYPNEGVIVYCLSRKDTESIANALVDNGIPAVAYHAGLSAEVRKKISEDFAGERANIIVATIAFGMGIDRANVRCVIHECLPKSIEGYQQETGRAGRDGLPSECVLLYSHGDVVRLKRLLTAGAPDGGAHHVRLLEEVRRFATSHQCRHKTLSEHFGQPYDLAEEGCGACDVCLGGMQALDDSSRRAHQILRTASDLLVRGRGRSYGVGFLVGVLTGARTKPILERHGDKATGYGVFSKDNSERVSSWVHQLMDLGLLAVTDGDYPTFALTEDGRAAMQDEREILLQENVALLQPAGSSRSKSGGAKIDNVDDALFEKLRTWRRETAAERQVPAYVIFHDATLMRISANRPSSVAKLKALSGVGDRRAEEFGAEVIAIVQAHLNEIGVPADQPVKVTREPAVAVKVTPKLLAYGDAFARGESIESIAAKNDVKPVTVWGHLADWVAATKPLSIDCWVAPPTQTKIAAAIDECACDFLKPVYEHLDGEFSYDVIRVVKAFVMANHSESA